MPKITHHGVTGTPTVSVKTLPFWLRNGWEPADDDPAPVETDPYPPTVAPAVGDDPAGGQPTSTPTPEE